MEQAWCAETVAARTGPRQAALRGTWTRAPTPSQAATCNWQPHAKEKIVFSSGVSLGELMHTRGGSMPSSKLPTLNQLKANFCRLLSHIILFGPFLSYWSFACILLFPILCFYRFCLFFVCVFLFYCFVLLVCFLRKEGRRVSGWIGGEVGGIWEELGRGNHGQNILRENYFFSRKIKVARIEKTSHYSLIWWLYLLHWNSLFLDCDPSCQNTDQHTGREKSWAGSDRLRMLGDQKKMAQMHSPKKHSLC